MLLAQNNLFAAEIHPYQGSLEDLYLQEVATSSSQIGLSPDVEALAGPNLKRSSEGKNIKTRMVMTTAAIAQ